MRPNAFSTFLSYSKMHSYLWQCCGNNVLAPAIIPRATRFLSDTYVAVIILFVLCAQSMLSLTRLLYWKLGNVEELLQLNLFSTRFLAFSASCFWRTSFLLILQKFHIRSDFNHDGGDSSIGVFCPPREKDSFALKSESAPKFESSEWIIIFPFL